jgi:predicted O-methyltransferase YrrM
MNEATWEAVDHYFEAALSLSDPVLEAALAAGKAAGLPEIQVAPNQGKLLHMLARLVDARRILEIGTLGGYSAIWLGRALAAGDPGARMISLEYEPRHAAVARANLERAGLAARVEVRVGAALDLLPQIAGEGVAPFDLVFIDADKENNPHYFDWSLKLTRPGSLIIVDNVVRSGAVADAASTDRSVRGTRALFDRIRSEPRVTGTAIQTVGVKGYDGLAVIQVVNSSATTSSQWR